MVKRKKKKKKTLHCYTKFKHFSFSPFQFGAGKNFLLWNGSQPELIVTEPELIKEILNNRDNTYVKEKPGRYIDKLLGDGLVFSTGEKWTKMRKLANNAFHAESLKVIS